MSAYRRTHRFRIITTIALLAPLFLSGIIEAQPFQRRAGALLNERPNCVEHTTDNGYIVVGTEKELTDI